MWCVGWRKKEEKEDGKEKDVGEGCGRMAKLRYGTRGMPRSR